MEQNYQAIIIDKKDLKEADRLYFIYTLEKGKIKAIGRGTKKLQAKLSSGLEKFNLARISLAKNRGIGNITGVVVENYFSHLKNNLNNLELAFRAAQRFNGWMDDEEPSQEIFYLWKDFLEILNQKKLSSDKARLIYQAFLFQLLALLGYRLEVGHCVICRRKISLKNNYFSASQGGVVCDSCVAKAGNKIGIHSDSIKIIRLFLTNRLTALQKLRVAESSLRETDKILNYFIQWIE